MAIRKGNKRAVTTLNPKQQEALSFLSKKYNISESKILSNALNLKVAQEQAHFNVGLKSVHTIK